MSDFSRNLNKSWHFFRDCLGLRMRLVLITLGAVIVFNLIDVAIPKVLQLYVDSLGNKPLLLFGQPLPYETFLRGSIFAFPLILLVLATLRWYTAYRRTDLQTRLGQGVMFELRNRIYDTMQSLSFAYHDRTHSGTLISNIIEDVGQASGFIQRGLFPFLEGGIYIVLAYTAMAMLSWPVTLASIALLACFTSWTLVIYFHLGYRQYQKGRTLFTRTVGHFSESMEGYPVISAFGRRTQRLAEYNDHVEAFHTNRYREFLIHTLSMQSFLLPSMIGTAVTMMTAIWVMQNWGWTYTQGELFYLFLLQWSIYSRFRMFARCIDQWLRFMIAAGRMGQLFAEDEYLDDAAGTVEDRCRWINPDAPLLMENVSFRYPGREHSINRVSLCIEPGQTIGLVGGPGAGKSTLALLLCRFYDPSEGEVRIGETPLQEIPLRDLRQQFSLVFQDTFLFSASIRDNIAYGNPQAPFEEIIAAATMAQIHEFIMSLPGGYDTVVGERGVTLSGGQRQRVSIARALLRKPRYLILDDCTSALDSQTEKAIQDGLGQLRHKTTMIIIAHRFSSIADADRVFVLEDGRIREDGRPADLAVEGTAFHRILQIQKEAAS